MRAAASGCLCARILPKGSRGCPAGVHTVAAVSHLAQRRADGEGGPRAIVGHLSFILRVRSRRQDDGVTDPPVLPLAAGRFCPGVTATSSARFTTVERHMERQTLHDWLTEQASGSPTPGGGAVAALSAATSAALISMVCNLTVGKPKYAAHEDRLQRVRDTAEVHLRQATALVEDDSRAFSAVMAAYRLPKDSDEARAARERAIQERLTAAADVGVRTADVAASLIRLASDLPDRSNPNVLSDVAVAAMTARAALEAALLNVTVNADSMADPCRREALSGIVSGHQASIASAGQLAAAVAERISR